MKTCIQAYLEGFGPIYWWNVLFMKCFVYEMFVYEMFGLWNVWFMECLVHEMFGLWNVWFMVYDWACKALVSTLSYVKKFQYCTCMCSRVDIVAFIICVQVYKV